MISNLTLAQAKERIGGRMPLEGGVQDGDFYQLEPEEMVRVVEETVSMGKPGGWFRLVANVSPEHHPDVGREEYRQLQSLHRNRDATGLIRLRELSCRT